MAAAKPGPGVIAFQAAMHNFSTELLDLIGAPHTDNNYRLLAAWQLSEGSPGFGRNNPFNIVSPPPGFSSTGPGVQRYGSLSEGAHATAAQLMGGRQSYAAIVQLLRSNADPAKTAQAIAASPWAGGHYQAGSTQNTIVRNLHEANPPGGGFSIGDLPGDIGRGAGDVLGGPANAITGALGSVWSAIVEDTKYVAEVLIGIILALLGAFIILHDTGGTAAIGTVAKAAVAA